MAGVGRAVAHSLPCSPVRDFSTATGFRCPSPLAEQPPHTTPRARGARGVSRLGVRRPPNEETRPMNTTAAAPTPAETADRIVDLRTQIDACDDSIIELLNRRLTISREIGALRAAVGGPRLSLSREQQILAKF